MPPSGSACSGAPLLPEPIAASAAPPSTVSDSFAITGTRVFDGAAAAFGFTDRGRIAPGLRADLLLVNGDPTANIKATRAIRRIWKAGVEVERQVPAPPQHLH